jgi:hypothetical protein
MVPELRALRFFTIGRIITDSQYKGAYTVFFKEKINLVMRNSNNRF